MIWLCHLSAHLFLHHLTPCRVSGWMFRVSGQEISFKSKGFQRFSGLLQEAPGQMSWNRQTVLDLYLPCAVNAASALDPVWQWEIRLSFLWLCWILELLP